MNCCHDCFCTFANYGRKAQQSYTNRKLQGIHATITDTTDSKNKIYLSQQDKLVLLAFIQAVHLSCSDPQKDRSAAH